MAFVQGTDQFDLVIYEGDAANNLGVGQKGGNRDNNDRTVEFHWNGASLLPNTEYRVQLVNRSSSSVQYCLATSERSSCP
jgi:hypothetical protein